jgi:hypothetical protein
MSNEDFNLDDEAPYEFEKSGKGLTFISFARGTMFVAASAASVSLGYQIGGPALANMLFGATAQVENTAIASVSNNATAAGGQGKASQQLNSSKTANLVAGSAPQASKASVGASKLNSGYQNKQTVVAPVNSSTVSFGNVSSATPSAGKVATGGSASGFKVEDAYESESNDRG